MDSVSSKPIQILKPLDTEKKNPVNLAAAGDIELAAH